jgi:hypothetical protein
MAGKEKKTQTEEKPKEEPQEEKEKPPAASNELSREQLEALRRKLSKKFH